MKVFYCYRYGILGGVCTQLINRLRAFQNSGEIEMHLVFKEDHGISRTLNGYQYLHFEPDAAKVRELAMADDFAAAVVVDTPEYLHALSNIPGLPLITEVHTTVEGGLRYLRNRNWSTAGYIVPSEYSRWLLREEFGIGRNEPVRVVPNSLDTGLFPRTTLPAEPSRPIFGWVGKLDDHKNWRGFLQVAAEITRRGVDADFWLIGGETAPPDRQIEVVDEIARLDLHACCRWFPRIEYQMMHRLYATVRASGGAMVATTINESFGMSVLEAVMCGCPVLASRVGALPEIMPGRSYLRFFDSGNAEQAAEAGVEMIQPDLAVRLRKDIDADYSRIVAKYSCQAVATCYSDTLLQLIDHARHTQSTTAHQEQPAAVVSKQQDAVPVAPAIAANQPETAKAEPSTDTMAKTTPSPSPSKPSSNEQEARPPAEHKSPQPAAPVEKQNASEQQKKRPAAKAETNRADVGGNGHGVPVELERAIRELRERMPNGRWQPREDAAFLHSFAKMLDQRSFLMARRLCESPRNGQFWATLPSSVAKIILRPR